MRTCWCGDTECEIGFTAFGTLLILAMVGGMSWLIIWWFK